MKREELLRRLEERLARGEISEKTYSDIKARYDAMPEEPTPPEEPSPLPPPPGPKYGPGRDLEAAIEQTIESAMQQVGRALEGTVGSKDFEARMEDVGKRLEKAFSKFGPRVEAGGRTIVIRGSGVVSGNTAVDEFKCSGSGKVTGDLHADEVHISGACKIDGACEGDEFQASGSASVGSDLKADEITVSGSLNVGGSILESREINVAGNLHVARRILTQEFTSRGRFEIGEALEAQEVSVRLAGTSRVPLLRAQEIDVRRGQRNGELEADVIEGEEVYLEATRARIVRGTEVRIGPFCTIDRVEAQNLEVHEMSTVKEQGPSEGGDERSVG